jgi:hypothetical protein
MISLRGSSPRCFAQAAAPICFPCETSGLVSDEPGTAEAGIELVLAGGRRLRIAKGVDEPTLRSVLAALEQPGC